MIITTSRHLIFEQPRSQFDMTTETRTPIHVTSLLCYVSIDARAWEQVLV